MPTEQWRPVASSTAACTCRAVATGSSVSTPTNASSHPSTSTTAPGVARSVSITRADAASYTGKSTGRNTASGERRLASLSASPLRTPCARAS